jgi:uncharacterized protein (DUF111 family)
MVYGHTALNRTVYASPPYGGSGYVRLGHGLAIPTPHHATVCQPWSLLRKALIRAGKPSYTAGTLCAIGWQNLIKL